MNKKRFFTPNAFYMTLALVSTQTMAAANFDISPIGTLPTTIAAGQTVTANFTITNMTHSARIGYSVQGLPTTVTQNTASPNCSNPINLAANASCQLKLDITGAVTSKFAICKANSCTTSPYPLNVSVTNAPAPPASTRAYITQYFNNTLLVENNPVMQCTINQTNGLLENCQAAGGGNIIANIQPQGIAVNKNGNTAYLTSAQYQDSIAYQCSITPETGLFNNCTPSNITFPSGYSPYYGMLALNANNTFAYLVDYYGSGGRILSCPLNNNIIQSTCIDSGAVVTEYAVGITLNTTNTIAYIGNYDYGYITTCTVNNGIFSNCANKTGDGTFTFTSSGPTGVALNKSGTIIYMTDYGSGTVYGCDTTSPTDATTFNNCFVASQNVPSAWGIALNATNTFAYITDYLSTVYVCPIKEDATFDTCIPNNTFTQPVGISLI